MTQLLSKELFGIWAELIIIFFTHRERFGFPKFKKKYDNKQSYTSGASGSSIKVDFENNKIKLPKIKWVKVKGLKKFTGKIYNATVKKMPSGKYFISLCVTDEMIPAPTSNNKIGLDLGLKDFITMSNGLKITNPKIFQKHEKQLIKCHKSLSKKKKKSTKYNKERKKVAKIYEKITNARKDFIHKISHNIIIKNQVIVSEKLNVQNMLKNRRLSKAIANVSWYELTRQLGYKAKRNNRTYLQIDTFFPSSQMCSMCGYKNTEIKNLKIRHWKCKNCNTEHDRDVNAAKNILAEGVKMIGMDQPDFKPVELELFSDYEAIGSLKETDRSDTAGG